MISHIMSFLINLIPVNNRCTCYLCIDSDIAVLYPQNVDDIIEALQERKRIPLKAQREDEETLGPETDELTPLIRQLEKKYGARIDILHCREMDISSADIRGRLREGKDVSDVLPGGVIDIIRDRKLYTEE